MQLILVRHPAPDVAPGVCYGRTDLAVAPAVLDAAVARLRPRLPAGVPVWSSPLRRCLMFAQALAQPVTVDARLAEMDFGSWEMQPWNSIPRADIDAWAADVAAYRPGSGESATQMAVRISDFYADLERAAVGRAIIICHAGSMRLLAARQRGLDPLRMAQEAAARPHAIAYGEVMVLGGV